MYLSGIFPALTTPFYPDGRVYFRKIEHNVDRYSRTPVAGLVIMGSTGEAIMLSDEEKRDVLRTVREFAAQEKVLIAGVGAESVRETLALCDFAAEQKYDVALVRTPHFYRPQMTPETMMNFYRTVADHSPLPVLLYSVPVYTAYDLPVEAVAKLSEHPNIIGMKDSSGNLEKIRQILAQTRGAKHSFEVTEVFHAVTRRMKAELAKDDAALVKIEGAAPIAVAPKQKIKTRMREVGFQLLSGTSSQILESQQAGCCGSVLGAASFVPTACFEVVAALKDNDIPLATEKQQRLLELSKKIVAELGVPGIKYACDWNGYYGGPPRLPLLPLTMEQKKLVETVLADLRN